MTFTLSPTRVPSAVAAARTVEVTKVYGSDATVVRALDGVAVEFPSGGGDPVATNSRGGGSP